MSQFLHVLDVKLKQAVFIRESDVSRLEPVFGSLETGYFIPTFPKLGSQESMDQLIAYTLFTYDGREYQTSRDMAEAGLGICKYGENEYCPKPFGFDIYTVQKEAK